MLVISYYYLAILVKYIFFLSLVIYIASYIEGFITIKTQVKIKGDLPILQALILLLLQALILLLTKL